MIVIPSQVEKIKHTRKNQLNFLDLPDHTSLRSLSLTLTTGLTI
jgi:hypothetical protein